MLQLGCRQPPRPPTSSLSDGDPRSLSVHPSRNVHRCQLLEEQLGCIRNVHLRDPRLVLARPAFKRILLEVPDVKVSKGSVLSASTPPPLSVNIGLTQWESSAHRYHICAPGRHPTPRITALSKRHSRHARSCSHAPSPRIGDLHL